MPASPNVRTRDPVLAGVESNEIYCVSGYTSTAQQLKLHVESLSVAYQESGQSSCYVELKLASIINSDNWDPLYMEYEVGLAIFRRTWFTNS